MFNPASQPTPPPPRNRGPRLPTGRPPEREIPILTAAQHPGVGVPFYVYVGYWDPDSNGPVYEDFDNYFLAIDWCDGGPTPEAGARGGAVRKPSTDYGEILDITWVGCIAAESY